MDEKAFTFNYNRFLQSSPLRSGPARWSLIIMSNCSFDPLNSFMPLFTQHHISCFPCQPIQ
eukprot:m.287908 g.287908  ORF g.287908 m.287908 type:complete len:61 (-) comp22930_c2_seq37:949-1131(-)